MVIIFIAFSFPKIIEFDKLDGCGEIMETPSAPKWEQRTFEINLRARQPEKRLQSKPLQRVLTGAKNLHDLRYGSFSIFKVYQPVENSISDAVHKVLCRISSIL